MSHILSVGSSRFTFPLVVTVLKYIIMVLEAGAIHAWTRSSLFQYDNDIGLLARFYITWLNY